MIRGRAFLGRRIAVDGASAAFGCLLALAAALVFLDTRGLSFYGDDWDFIVDRPGHSLDVLLTPHGPHLSLIPILIYKALLKLFGGGSYLPFRLVAVFDMVLLAGLLGVVARRRWGGWWGLAPVLLFVTLGLAGPSTLWSFQCGYAIALAGGLLALLSVERGGRRWDLLACGSLIVALASASQGIGFTVGTALVIALRPGWRRRAWIVLVPTVLYGLWYLKYGHRYSDTDLSLLRTSLLYAFKSLSATFASLIGLSTVPPQTDSLDMTYGVPVTLAAVGAILFGLWRGWRPGPLFWGAAATAIVLWTAASTGNGKLTREPNQARYLVTNALLVLVCVIAAIKPAKLPARGTAVVLAVALAVVAATNLAGYSQAYDDFKTSDVKSRAELGALLVMRGVVAPEFTPSLPGDPSVLVGVNAQNFYSVYDHVGLIADSQVELLRQTEFIRDVVDQELARGELALTPQTGPPSLLGTPPTIETGTAEQVGGCLVLGSAPVVVSVPANSHYYLRPSRTAPLTVGLRRFGSTFQVMLGSVAPGTASIVTAPPDRAPQLPWHMMLTGPGSHVCIATGAASFPQR